MKFIKPKNLNGGELRNELRGAGFAISDNFDSVKVIGDELFLEVEGNESEIGQIVAQHDGTTNAPELTIQQKLENLGLSLDDLKAVLGA